MTGRSLPEWIGATPDTPIPPRVEMGEDLAIYEPRLLAKLVVAEDGCWNWTGAHCPKRYGHMKVGPKYEKAHRLAYRLYVGPIPPGMVVCHRCDNPPCANPAHLWVGTPRDNIHDCIAKGRQRTGQTFGEKNHFSKLTDREVQAIRRAPTGYGTGVALARQYGVRDTTICEIRKGRSRRLG